jgi:DNA-binding PadR family transcriptional regulator
MARGRKVGNLLALAVLSYLSAGPQHPYEVSRMLREHGDDRSIKFTHGSLYMVFQQLAKAGYIAERETTREGARPERTVYELTAAGRVEMRDWLCDLIEQPRHEYPHFTAALAFIAALPPDEVVTLLRRRLAALAEIRVEIRELIDAAHRQGVAELFLVEEEYRLALLDAETAFINDFIARIDDTAGIGPMWRAYHERNGS